MTRRKGIHRGAIAVAAVLLALGGALAFLLGTASGGRFLLARVQAKLPGLAVERFDGRLGSDFTLEGVRYRTPGLEARVERLTLSWDPWRLLRREVHVKRIGIESVDVALSENAAGPERASASDAGKPVPVLPVTIVVEELRLTNAMGSLPSGVSVTDVSLRGHGDTAHYEMELHARVEAPLAGGEKRAAAHVDLAGEGDLEAFTVGSLRVTPAGEDTGTLTAKGSVSWTPALAWDLALVADRVAVSDYLPDTTLVAGGVSFHAAIEGTLRGARGGNELDARARVSALRAVVRGDTLSGDADLAVQGTDVRADTLDFRWGETTLRGSGGYGSREVAGRIELHDLALERLAPELGPGNVLRSARIEASGSPDDYRLSGDAAFGLAFDPKGEGRLALTGSGDRRSFTVDRGHVEFLGGTVDATGSFVWSPQITWKGSLQVSHMDPAPFLPDPAAWKGGRISLAARTEGKRVPAPSDSARGRIPADLDATVAISRLAGSLRGQDLRGSGSVVLRGGEARLDTLDLRWGDASLRGRARLAGSEIDARLAFDVPDLGRLLPRGTGSVHTTAVVGGTMNALRVDADVTARELRLVGKEGEASAAGVANLVGTVRVDLAPGGEVSVDVRADSVATGGREIDEVRIQASGTRERHTLRAEAAMREMTLDAAFAGGIEGVPPERWRGEVTELRFAGDAAGTWQLAAPGSLLAGPGKVSLERLTLRGADGSLALEGTWDAADGWRGTTEMERLSLGAFDPFLPAGTHVTGTLSGHASARGGPAGIDTVDVSLVPGPGTITAAGPGPSRGREGPQSIVFEQGSLHATAGAQGVVADLAVTLHEVNETGGFAHVTATADLPPLAANGAAFQPGDVDARLNATFPDLSVLEIFLPRVSGVGGALELDASLRGPQGNVAFEGELRLRDGTADVPDLGLQLRAVALTARAARQTVHMEGGLSSGGGKLTWKGDSPFHPTPENPARVELSGERVPAMDTGKIRVFLTPQLNLRYNGERVDVDGEVRVPRAKVEMTEIPESAVLSSPDVVITSREEEKPPIVPVSARVRVALGDSVTFQGFGFQGRLGGSILVTEEPGRPTAGTGELLIREGTYRAYGQDLRIDEGRVVFGGGTVDNPGLDLRAYRKAADNVTAGLIVGGTLRSPEVTLYSEPPMSQSDALAYLVLGRRMARETQETDQDIISKAAIALGIRGGDVLTQRLARTVGLDEARIESNGSIQEAAFVAGKYLSPRLFVSYGIGLFQNERALRVRYLLSRRWTIEAESGQATGTDILYRIERGRPKRDAAR